MKSAEELAKEIESLKSQLLAQAKVLERMRESMRIALNNINQIHPNPVEFSSVAVLQEALFLPTASAEEEVRLMEKVVQEGVKLMVDDFEDYKDNRYNFSKAVKALEAFRKGGGA